MNKRELTHLIERTRQERPDLVAGFDPGPHTRNDPLPATDPTTRLPTVGQIVPTRI